MNLTSRLSYAPTTARPRPAELLGTHHPLVRDLERLTVACHQSVIVAGVLGVGVATLVAHSAAGLALIIAAALVELLIACRIAMLRESRRVHVLDLIAEGQAELPIAIVARTCARLCRARHRQRLARSIETLLERRPGGFDVVVTPWRFARPELLVGVRAELRDISVLLRDPDARVEGIALVERLRCDGTSWLPGDDPQLLREELGRVRFRLQARSPGALRLERSGLPRGLPERPASCDDAVVPQGCNEGACRATERHEHSGARPSRRRA